MKARGRKDKLITYGDGQMRGKGHKKSRDIAILLLIIILKAN